jgi:DNA-directed RNA polymerase I subunit RPA1
VTHWNVEKLRQAVRNGPNVYPGATHFEDEQGIVHLSSVSQYQRNPIAKKLLSTPGAASSVITVSIKKCSWSIST